MKYIAKYSLIGFLALIALVVLVNQLHLSGSGSSRLLSVGGVLLFTALGVLLKKHYKIGKQSDD